MKRIPEPELMTDPEQAAAYARADFSEPHNEFIQRFQDTFAGHSIEGDVLDLGCGPGDIAIRFARAFSGCTIYGVDGAKAMLDEGQAILAQLSDVASRVHLICALLPNAELPQSKYDIIISNSLLHHLPDPQILWSSIKRYGAPGGLVFIMDLMRPESKQQAQELVRLHAAEEPEILQHDFYHSLLAAYTAAEVQKQLQEAELNDFTVKTIKDNKNFLYK